MHGAAEVVLHITPAVSISPEQQASCEGGAQCDTRESDCLILTTGLDTLAGTRTINGLLLRARRPPPPPPVQGRSKET